MSAMSLWEGMGIGTNMENGGETPLHTHGSAMEMERLPARSLKGLIKNAEKKDGLQRGSVILSDETPKIREPALC